MGYNRSGTIRKNRLKRAKKEQERLAKKAGGEATTGAGQAASKSTQTGSK